MELKRKLFVRMFLLLVFVCAACSKDDTPGEETSPVTVNRVKTAKGESLGTAISKKIGKEGGVIELPSQAITVTIPAGALQEETTFGIEMITNTNPASVGAAYRLTPANITLSKPVTISLPLENMKDAISVPEALAVAYQTAEGYWNVFSGKKTKDINGQLTAVTTHLGDIGPMQWLFLKPVQASVSVNETIQLEAIRYIPAPADPDDFLVVPLVPKSETEETPVLIPVPLEARYIKKWEVDGPGTLTPYGNKAIYQALSSVVSGNAAAVSVELKTKTSKVLLVSNLEITTDEYLRIRVNDGPVINLNPVANYTDDAKTVFGVAGVHPENNAYIPFVISGKAKKGSYPWDDDNIGGDNATDAGFQYYSTSGEYVIHHYEPGNGIPYEASPGGLQILEIGKTGDYVVGKFSATKAGLYNSDHHYKGTRKIEGEFKVLLHDIGNDISKQKGKAYSTLKQALGKMSH